MRFFQYIANPITWIFRSSARAEKRINGFTDWFGSVPGFKQQMTFMLGWVLIAIVFPRIDPNMFHLMAFLTIYSGVTQPLLAIQNARSGYMMVKMLQSQQNQLRAMQAMIQHLADSKGE